MNCPHCQADATQVGDFWICPQHGQLPEEKPFGPLRVFISSTFRDMHAERDHLVTVVFPELRERCERLGPQVLMWTLAWACPRRL